MPGVIQRALRPFQQFFATEAAGGVVLLACTAVALGWANSPWSHGYFELWEQTLSIDLGAASFSKSLHHWINDGLMVVFFLLVGLEIKREMMVGELASLRRAAMPVAAAFGGMALPALIYIAFNAGTAGSRGWAIPVATDIAFALGVLALLGSRVPVALKVFLAALAIADDIGAVLVIAFFYTAELSLPMLGAAAAIVVTLLIVNRAGVAHIGVYVALGLLLWLAVLSSGIHATIAGVLLAMTIPARTRIDEDEFISRARAALGEFEAAEGPARSVIANPAQQEALHLLDSATEQVQSPLMKLEHRLHAAVAFGIMPLFALANAGVALQGDIWGMLDLRIVLGIVLGLMLGKSVGITAASLLSQRMGIAQLPAGVSVRALHGMSWLGGIGFTMSLFVASLAFQPGALLDSAKVGILGGSLLSGTVGWMLLRRSNVPASGNGVVDESVR